MELCLLLLDKIALQKGSKIKILSNANIYHNIAIALQLKVLWFCPSQVRTNSVHPGNAFTCLLSGILSVEFNIYKNTKKYYFK